MAQSSDINTDAVMLRINAVWPKREDVAAEYRQQPHCVAISGVIEAIGSDVHAFSVGDKVLTLREGSIVNDDASTAERLTATAGNLVLDRMGVSSEEAISLLHAIWSAAALLLQTLDLPTLHNTTERKPSDLLYNKRILILGGEGRL